MKKILIISYFYEPCSLTAAQRIAGWAKYLNEFGYYPIIITRNWDNKISKPEDVLVSSGNEIVYNQFDTHEVYYLPYRASLRDRLFVRFQNVNWLQKLTKVLTLVELIGENFSNSFISYSNLHKKAESVLEKDKQIKAVIISGNPFNQFRFGFLLNKKFNIPWIADYRDDWNTSELELNFGKIKKFISKLQSKSEKKWVGTSECITSVSKVYVDKIGKFVNKKGYVVLNGYDGLDHPTTLSDNKSEFNITYNGSLYNSQPIEPLLEVMKKLILDQTINLKIKLNFPGLAFDKSQKQRIENFLDGFEDYFSITDRIPKNEVIKIQQNSDLLLMIAHKGLKGIPSSKLYEYVGMKKRILLFPNDHDIIEETLLDTGLGLICNSESELYEKLLKMILEKQNNLNQPNDINQSKIDYYSRKNQTAELAKLLDEVIG